MGERGNIVVGNVWLYTHWRGDELKSILRDALMRGKSRWHDQPYLTRIIFCEMIGDDTNGTDGFGIADKMQDNNYPILTVDVDKQEVRENVADMDKWKLGKVLHKWSFQEFVESV